MGEEKAKLLQELRDAHNEITELKKVRKEDAKANEKVVSIIASQKQIWLKERYTLKLQIEALMKELRNMEMRKSKSLSEMEQEKRKCKDLEEKLSKADKEVEDLKEAKEKDVKEHSNELWKQKKTFLEFASSQRQLEAELSRANKQIEAKISLLEDFSLEIIKLRKDLEEKDQMLKQKLHKETKAKQDEDDEETKKWRKNSKSRKHERRSLRSMFAFEATSKPKTKSVSSITDVVPEIMDSYSIGSGKKHEDLIFEEKELFIRVISKKEDNVKLKDEKVEALCLHLMNTELESKRLRSCIDGLNQEMSQLRQNTKKEERERETTTTEKGRGSYSPEELRHLTLKAAQSDAEEGYENDIHLQKNENPLSSSNPPWRMDLHALGISYKIKRLKQQLMMLERYIGNQEIDKSNIHTGKKALLLIITLLNKQVTRYQSLQEKIDDLCKRMHVNDPKKISVKMKETKVSLEHFLDETFQLQRYIVATGQKLMEIQSKIASGFVEIIAGLISTESSACSTSFDPERYAESIKTMFQQVQRGLQIRISRIIGDLEGTLARAGMIHLKTRGDMEQPV